MIFVFSGTKDGRIIIQKLLKMGHNVIASTATEYGGQLIALNPNLKVISKKLDKQDMIDTMRKNNVKLVIDATHPYAAEVSKNAIESSSYLDIPYIRYERKTTIINNVIKFSNYDKLVNWLKDKEGNILLTIGSNNLDIFSNKLDTNRIFTRVLPTTNVIKKCETLGFKPKQILGLQGPFSKKFNKIIYKDYDIKYMVTKDSGKVGGTIEKIEAADESGVTVLMIERPKIDYPIVFHEIDDLIINIKEIVS